MEQVSGKSEVSRIFGVSLPTVNAWVRRGCPTKKDGRNWLFEVKAVENWLDERHKNKATDSGYERAKQEKMYWKAKLAKLEYEKAIGKLIDADEVKAAAFNTARIARDSLTNIADRLAPILTGKTNTFEIHAIINEEIKKIIDEFCKDLQMQSKGGKNGNN